VEVLLEVLRLEKEALMPTLAYGESAAWDLYAYVLNDVGRPMTTSVSPRTSKRIRTGLAMRAPVGNVLLVCSRSGLATKSIFVANAPGVVDPDYTGEIEVILHNGGLEPHYVKHGDRIGQILIVPLTICQLHEVTTFPRTERGKRGFGSTGD
jgi:dUTP pyrophosphatase